MSTAWVVIKYNKVRLWHPSSFGLVKGSSSPLPPDANGSAVVPFSFGGWNGLAGYGTVPLLDW